MVRVLHVITSLGAGGAEAMLSKVALEVEGKGAESRVLSLGDLGQWGPRLRAGGLPVAALGLGSAGPRRWVSALDELELHQWRPEIVQGWMYHGNLGASALAAFLGRPCLWNIRATWDPSGFGKVGTRLVMEANRLLSRQPDLILCNSLEAIRGHRRAGFGGRWRLIPNGFDTARFRPDAGARAAFRASLGLDARHRVIGMAARFHPMKDHGNLLAAWGRIAPRFPEAHLVLAGTGVLAGEPWFRAALAGLPGAERVHLLGECADMAAFQASLDLAVLSSAYGEAFPNTLGEAMACEVPCVATDVGDSRDVLGATGRIVPPRDAEALAGALADLLDLPPEALRRLAEAARERVQGVYGLPAIGRQYLETYADVLGRPQGSPT